MKEQEFEEICKQVANIPWLVDTIPDTYFEGKFIKAKSGIATIRLYRFDEWQLVRPGKTLTMIEMDLALARIFFEDIELENMTREIAPYAPWIFGPGRARMDDWRIVKRENGRWELSQADRGICFVGTVAEVVAAYREHRSTHENKRDVRMRVTKERARVNIRGLCDKGPYTHPDEIDVEHARNLLRCMANPDKYTRISEWALRFPYLAEAVIHRALETECLRPIDLNRGAEWYVYEELIGRIFLVGIYRTRAQARAAVESWPNSAAWVKRHLIGTGPLDGPKEDT